MSLVLYHHLATALHHSLSALRQILPDPAPVNPIQSPPPAVMHELARRAHAHPNSGGCIDSPEAPTNLLTLVGATGLTLAWSLARRRQRTRMLLADNRRASQRDETAG